MLEFRLLGPVEVRDAERSLELGTVKQQIVLAALAVNAGRPVTAETLIDRAWGEAPPPSVRSTLHAHVSRIRRLLDTAGDGTVSVVRRSRGYVLEVDPDAVDHHRFRRLVDRVSRADLTDGDVAASLEDALDLWHGPPLAGLPGQWAEALRQTLGQQRIDVVVRWAGAQLRLDNAEAVFQPLRELLSEHPTAEPVATVLMQALHQAGRAAEALNCYETIRRRLAEDLGSDPGRELALVHAAVLRGEPLPPPGATHGVRAADASHAPRPAMLPPAVGHFTGRDDELAVLDAMAAGSQAGGPSVAVPVLAIVGPAGVGKTALAVEWAHRAAPRYPDGSLYLDLRGFSASPPVQPLEALAGLLTALGDEPHALPTDVDRAAARYRSLLAGRRVLVVLDNARDAAQVLPLLPADPACALVVTSRHRVTGLVAHAAAQRLTLDPMLQGPALDLLDRMLPATWVRQDQASATALAEACGHLPLALCVAAANIAGQPEQPFAEQVARLLSRPRLSALQIEDDDVPGPRAAFDASYATLDDVQRRTFRRLGLLPGPDADAETAAVLAQLPVAAAEACLDRLVGVHLVQRSGGRRFSLHDLLREYAVERLQAEDGAEREALTTSLLDHYLARAESAGRVLYPHSMLLNIDPAPDGGELFGDPGTAAAWLAAELPNLLAAVPLADRSGHRAAWRLHHALRGHFWTTRYTVDWLPIAQAAVRSADAAGDLRGGAASRSGLGHIYMVRGRNEEARQCYEGAVRLARQAGWRRGEAATLGNLGSALAEMGDLPAAQHAFAAAIDIFGQLQQLYGAREDRLGESLALGSLGLIHYYQGDHAEAIHYLSRARAIHRELGAGPHEVISLRHIVDAELERGRLEVVERLAQECLDLSRHVRRLDVEISALVHLSTVDRLRGQADSALVRATRARELLGSTPDASIEAIVFTALGAARLLAGQGRGALADHDRAVAVDGGSGYVAVQAVLARAATRRALGDEEPALADAERAVAEARAKGYAGLERQAREFLRAGGTAAAP